MYFIYICILIRGIYVLRGIKKNYCIVNVIRILDKYYFFIIYKNVVIFYNYYIYMYIILRNDCIIY